MRLHRFYINQEIGERKEISLSDIELIHQLLDVFRFKIGNQVILFDGSGFEYVTEIVSHSKKEVVLKIISQSAKVNQSCNVSLYLALIKKSNFELAAEKCTEVGVSEIHPVISERSEKKGLNIERLNKIVKEASEQSGRVVLPKVFEVTDLEAAISQAVSEGKECVVFHTTTNSSGTIRTNSLHLTQTNRSENCPNGSGKKVCVFVGPEGGWTDSEMQLFRKNNFQIKSLGQNILRAETAAIIATWSQINN